MPHISLPDRKQWAFWITGAPGSGLISVGELFDGFYTDLIGYRTSHERHREWFISPEVLKYKMTNPEATNPCFYGTGNNYLEISFLPWKMIFILEVSELELTKRVTKYRSDHKIIDGRSHSEVSHSMFQLQSTLIKAITRTHNKVIVINADGKPEEIASQIRKVVNDSSKTGNR